MRNKLSLSKSEFSVLIISVLVGSVYWVIDSGFDFYYLGGNFLDALLLNSPTHHVYFRILVAIGFLSFGLAISFLLRKRRLMEEELITTRRESEDEKAKAEAIINCIGDGIILQDLDYKVIYENEAQRKAIGDHVGQLCYKAFEGNDRLCDYCPMVLSLKDGGVHRFVKEANIAGQNRWFELTSSPLKDSSGTIVGGIKVVRDITDSKSYEKRLNESLKEKEILLREIHHRVKNNMQVIASLMNIQSAYVRHEEDKVLFYECRDRIKAMSLVHESLYQSGDLSSINISNYVKELIANLYMSHKSSFSRVSIHTDIVDTDMAIDTAIPCGLILNELLTNCLRHAFPDDRGGSIDVRLIKGDDNMFELSVKDNGVGIDKDVDYTRSETMGMMIVTTLAEKQLNGDIKIELDNGTRVAVIFPEHPYSGHS